MKLCPKEIARVVCWSVRHPMQYGSKASQAEAEDAVRLMGLPLTKEIRDEIANHLERWQPIGG